jgi:hypothetical protein
MEDITELNKYLIPELSNIVDSYLTGEKYQDVINELLVLIYYHNYGYNYDNKSMFLVIPRILEHHRINRKWRKLLNDN